jgi:hypothetical protein
MKRSMLDTPQRYPRAGSQSYPSPAAEPDGDGSTTAYFSPTQRAGVTRGNWIQTTPGKGWFTILRLYSLLTANLYKTRWPIQATVRPRATGRRATRLPKYRSFVDSLANRSNRPVADVGKVRFSNLKALGRAWRSASALDFPTRMDCFAARQHIHQLRDLRSALLRRPGLLNAIDHGESVRGVQPIEQPAG